VGSLRKGKRLCGIVVKSGSGGSVKNWHPRYGSLILKLDPNFGIGGITESGKNTLRHCCASGSGGSVNNRPPRYRSVILKLDPNFGIGGITERREKKCCGIVVKSGSGGSVLAS
jgi:hypothetical protein